MLRTIKECYALKWEIEFQGINVADKAAGVGGDVTVREGTKVLMAIEVTERPIDKARVISTFNTKIVEAGIEDYWFVYAHAQPGAAAPAVPRGAGGAGEPRWTGFSIRSFSIPRSP